MLTTVAPGADFAQMAAACGELNEVQTKIVESLRNLLGIARAAEVKTLELLSRRAQSDLPDDLKKKMEDLKKALDEAMDAQRKIIEAARALNKEHVDDFTEDEEQLMKRLAAAEDAWEKFINEAMNDLSKPPFQDFANPSLLTELIDIQTELLRKSEKEDALAKATDIAVPLEQLAYEMAEEIKVNLEHVSQRRDRKPVTEFQRNRRSERRRKAGQGDR